MSHPAEPAASAQSRTITIDLSRLPSAAAAVGVALVFASVVVATTYARKTGDLDGSVFSLGVLASLGLLAIAVVSELRLPGLERRAALVSWPGAAGIAGVGLMTAVLIENDAYILLGYTAALILFWALCAMASGHVGFRILIVVAAALMVPTSMSLLITRHPSWWQIGLGVLGGLALLVAALRAPAGRDIAVAESS